jgi:hypothetical protein
MEIAKCLTNIYLFGHQVKVNNKFVLFVSVSLKICLLLDANYKFYRGNRLYCNKRDDLSCKMGVQQYLSDKQYADGVESYYATMQTDGNFVVYVCIFCIFSLLFFQKKLKIRIFYFYKIRYKNK